jgi:hypothetical protein
VIILKIIFWENIHEQRDITAKAIEHYEKFLYLWKDADAGFAEVEDAKKRLAGLKKNNNNEAYLSSYL